MESHSRQYSPRASTHNSSRPQLPYAGFYGSTFGAISGCQPGSMITLTATVSGLTKSASALCPGYGNSTSINLSSTTSSTGTTSSVPVSLFTPWLWISSTESYLLAAIVACGIFSLKGLPWRASLEAFSFIFTVQKFRSIIRTTMLTTKSRNYNLTAFPEKSHYSMHVQGQINLITATRNNN